ncbi:MAG: hypothetical protein J6Y71_09820 [Ruminococcus sp.]|nr:hypothetical protein [Ruminococcus sp.]
MKKAKESSVKKSIRIPTDVVSELEKEAKQKFNLFSLEVSDLYRWEMNSAPIY